jgi:PTH1 family peptidyl-tRNA hydrolase
VRLVVGLGNPGERYAATRHNVAWRVLDELARRWPAEAESQASQYAARRARVGREAVVLMQPLTFMNEAGRALEGWLADHPDRWEGLLVISDDVYLPVGTLRLRARGASGGHRGLESIEAALQSRDFPRLRIGVGGTESGSQLREHVLDPFTPEQLPAVDEAVRRAADVVECWLADGIQAAMNRFNRRVRREVPES